VRIKLLNGAMIGILTAILVLFMAAGNAEEQRTDALADMVVADMAVLEGRGIGRLRDVAQTQEGMLLTGTTDLSGDWAVFLDHTGKELWSHPGLYRHPTALPNGGFSLVRVNADESLSLVALDKEGRAIFDYAISPHTRDVLAAGESVFMLGNQWILDEESKQEDEGLPYLSRLDSEAGLLWSCTYPHDYTFLQFEKAVYAMDSLFICANARDNGGETELGVLYRMDLDGNVLLRVEFNSDLGDGCGILDVCANEDGIIAVVLADYGYNDDYGYNVNRLSQVIGLNMDGDALWTHTFNDGEPLIDLIMDDGVMADHILPVPGGFLCAGYMISREDSGLSPIEWLLLLDKDGNVTAKDSTSDISSDFIRISGVASGADGKVLLYGANFEGLEIQENWEDGDYPGKPFFATLDFPEAYVLTPAVRSETAAEPLIEQIDELLTMSREEIIKKLGPDYSVEPVGPEGALDGYYYENLGMAFAFYADSDIPDFIECYPNFKIHGVGIGSLFSEIMEALGDTEIFETWLAHPDDKAFIVYYQLGDAMYSFVAFEEDGCVYILRIS